MKKAAAMVLGVLLSCAGASFISGCAADRIIGGGSLKSFSRRVSLPSEEIAATTEIVDRRYGRGGAYWDGPYSADEAAKIVGVTAGVGITLARFMADHPNARCFVCFEYLEMWGFPKGHVKGYSPQSILSIDGKDIAWFQN